MAEILLQNKKLFNKNIINFVYKNKNLFFENIDIITKFNHEYKTEKIFIDDKIKLYSFYNDNKENIKIY